MSRGAAIRFTVLNFYLCLLSVSALSATLQPRVQGLAAFALLSSLWIFKAPPDLSNCSMRLRGGFCRLPCPGRPLSSRLNWAIAGGSLALTLTVRSPLLLFARCWPSFPCCRFYGASLLRGRKLCRVFAGPLLIAAGWFYINYAVYNKPVFMDPREPIPRYYRGSRLGFNDRRQPLQIGRHSPGQRRLRMAAKEAASHPHDTHGCFPPDIFYFIGAFAPFSGRSCGFWLFRMDAGFRALAFLEIYFLLVHCSMSVEERYFMPFWPCLFPQPWLL